EITEDAEVLEVGQRTPKAPDFTGVAKIDFKRDQAGEHLVLEVNPRLSLWHHPAARAGVNIPAMIADYLSGAPVREYHVEPGVRWCNPWKDAVAARRQGSGAFSWLRFLLSTDARYAGHLDDPGASVGWLAHRVRMLNH
ncbi:MAG: hypothetical protein GY773_07300, partial [Actinomycetia bacterium]|nr:hypothetical protein [Actinomycetes bacterium]